eukprot:IDg9366t1
MSTEELMVLHKPSYGICDSGNYWGATFAEQIRKYIKMSLLTGHLAVFLKDNSGKTTGILGCFVEDLLFPVKSKFKEQIWKTKDAFDSKEVVLDNFEFVGVTINIADSDSVGLCIADQMNSSPSTELLIPQRKYSRRDSLRS